MFLLAVLAAQASPAPPQPIVQATATVRIERGSTVTSQEWDRSPHRREVVIPDEQGRPLLLRLVENQ